MSRTLTVSSSREKKRVFLVTEFLYSVMKLFFSFVLLSRRKRLRENSIILNNP